MLVYLKLSNSKLILPVRKRGEFGDLGVGARSGEGCFSLYVSRNWERFPQERESDFRSRSRSIVCFENEARPLDITDSPFISKESPSMSVHEL